MSTKTFNLSSEEVNDAIAMWVAIDLEGQGECTFDEAMARLDVEVEQVPCDCCGGPSFIAHATLKDAPPAEPETANRD